MGGPEITEAIAKEAMRLAQYKLPIKTKFLALADQPADLVADESDDVAVIPAADLLPSPALALES
jgi:large subunit ribosomal protein L16